MPTYIVQCKKCGYTRELILTAYIHYARIARILECDRCKEIGYWKKLPTAANFVFSGNGWGRRK